MDCYAVLNDGSVISTAGGYNVALLAKEFNVPLFVISP
jgi:translation initiation factor 2B subunit (eIF-2B alpha/beta/delta family)